MPVYQYACTECGEQLEVRQSFTDDALTVCPVCEGRLRKVLNAVGVVFKGSGFYRNDSRASATAGAPGASGTADGSAAKTGADKSDGEKGGDKEKVAAKSDSAAAAKPAAKDPGGKDGSRGSSSGTKPAAAAAR